ncbi:MAG: TetR/AcrR family transcriptional regulator, partial [Bacteroidota bacterium]
MNKQTYYVKESLKLFLKYGIRAVTIGQITSHLNVSSKTLYGLFSDKAALVEAAYGLYRTNFDRDYEILYAQAENVASAMLHFYQQLVQNLGRTNPNFYQDLANYFPQIWNDAEAYGIHRTQALLEQGVAEGIFVRGLNASLCAETLTLLLRSMFEREEFAQHDSRLLLTNVLWPYVRGICTPE